MLKTVIAKDRIVTESKDFSLKGYSAALVHNVGNGKVQIDDDIVESGDYKAFNHFENCTYEQDLTIKFLTGTVKKLVITTYAIKDKQC